MKDSAFLAAAKAYLGDPAQWCQKAFFVSQDAAVGPGENRSEDYLERPETIGSMCLDGALQLVATDLLEAAHGTRTKALALGADYELDRQLRRVRMAISATFFAQYPDVVTEINAELAKGHFIALYAFEEQGDIPVEPATLRIAPDVIPDFNDHRTMTYDGVLAVMDKTITDLQEADR